MSNITQHLDCMLQRERDKNEMLQAQNAEWQQQYETLHSLYVTLIERYQELYDNKRAQL